MAQCILEHLLDRPVVRPKHGSSCIFLRASNDDPASETDIDNDSSLKQRWPIVTKYYIKLDLCSSSHKGKLCTLKVVFWPSFIRNRSQVQFLNFVTPEIQFIER